MCNNCNKYGHLFHQCRLPITSYGIIVFRKNPTNEQYEFLMIRRKDTFGYIDLLRGKYQIHNTDKIQQLVDEMSNDEKKKVLTTPFAELWQQLWGGQHSKTDETTILRKFEMLLNTESTVSLETLIQNSSTNWVESEWEFPKGRKNYQEKDLDCALREFEEETGYSRFKLNIVENVIPYEEIFIGSNNKSYKHKYFVAMMDFKDSLDQMPFQATEVSKTEWKTHEKCLTSIRPYSLEKKIIISSVFEVISHLIIQ